MAKFTKKEEEPKSTPKKAKAPMVVDIHGVVKGKTFTDAKEVPMAFMGTFEDCNFDMDELKDRNFYSVKFVDCTFSKDFKFVHCNLGNAEGIDDVEMEASLTPIKPHVEHKKKR